MEIVYGLDWCIINVIIFDSGSWSIEGQSLLHEAYKNNVYVFNSIWRKVVHQWCGFRGGHSVKKPASTVVPMVSYGMSHSIQKGINMTTNVCDKFVAK
jgi:hypothetical protein